VSRRLTRSERQAETRAALIEAAGEVFLERGFAGASVEEITARAGFTRGAFYSNFASKEELLTELLHARIYDAYARMAEERLRDPGHQPTMRETGDALAGVQRTEGGEGLMGLLLELLAQSSRSEDARGLAATFWSGNRETMAELTRQAYAARGEEAPLDPKALATALIALDVGLSIQRYVDREDVPLSLWPELYAFLFGRHAPGGGGESETSG
jgi:AcrR family transcriptional regulator